MDRRMDAGLDTFALDIPPEFPARPAGRPHRPTIQLNVDATRMSQAFTGSGYIQTIVSGEVDDIRCAAIAQRRRPAGRPRRCASRFNPELNKSWFGAVMEVINRSPCCRSSSPAPR